MRFSNQNSSLCLLSAVYTKSEGCFNVLVPQGSDVQKDLGVKSTLRSLQNHAELKAQSYIVTLLFNGVDMFRTPYFGKTVDI